MAVRRPPFPQNPQDIPQPVAPVFPTMPTRGRENWFDQFRSVDPIRELRKPRKDLLQWLRRKKGGIGGLRRKLLNVPFFEGRQFPTGIPEQFRQLPFGPPSMGRILPNFGMKQKPMVPWDPPQDWRGQPIPARQLGPNVPEGFIPPSGMSTSAFVDYWNPTTEETWSAPSGGWTAPEGWERGGPPGSFDNRLIPWGGAQQPPPATVPEFLPNLVTGELERTSPSPMQPLPRGPELIPIQQEVRGMDRFTPEQIEAMKNQYMSTMPVGPAIPFQPLPEEMPMPSLTPEEITQQRIDQVSQFEQEPMMGARYVDIGGYAGGGYAGLPLSMAGIQRASAPLAGSPAAAHIRSVGQPYLATNIGEPTNVRQRPGGYAGGGIAELLRYYGR